MSKGFVIEPKTDAGIKESVYRKEILEDLKGLWQLVNNEVGGELIWASDPELLCSVPVSEYEMANNVVRNSYKYLSPGHLKYPKDFPVPGFGVRLDTYHPWNGVNNMFGLKFLDHVPLLVFGKPVEIDKTPLLEFKIEDVSTEDGKRPADNDENSLDRFLQNMKVPEAFAVEIVAFVPMAGEGQTYDTNFVPAVWCPGSDYRFATVKARTLVSHNWAIDADRFQDLEDISNPKDPKLFKAAYHPFSTDAPTPENAANQMIVIAQSGYMTKPKDTIKPKIRLRESGFGGFGFGGRDSYGGGLQQMKGFVFDAPVIEEGSSTGTHTTSVKFEGSEHPAVVYHLNIFGVTRADMPNVNPQGFAEFMYGALHK